MMRAPEIFRPAPLMLQQERTRTNVNSSIRVMLAKSKWNSYPRVVPPNMWSILQQRNERERDFLKPNLSQNPMETRARMCERECEWVCEYERAQHHSRPLFKEKMARAPEERQATMDMEPLEKVGPRSHWPWVGRPVGSASPRVGPLVPPLTRWLRNGHELWKYGARPKVLLEKMSKLLFSKGF